MLRSSGWRTSTSVLSAVVSILLFCQPQGLSGVDFEKCCIPGGSCQSRRCPLASVTEEVALNTMVANMTIKPAGVTVAIVGDAFGSTLFKLVTSTTATALEVKLQVKSRVDAEITPQLVYVELNMKESSSDLNTRLTVRITDINDNAPVFSLPVYRCEVYENEPNATCTGISLSDRDRIITKPTFSLEGADMSAGNFEVRTTANAKLPSWGAKHPRDPVVWPLEVLVKSPVNHESRKFFSLTIKAVDTSTKIATAQIMITVKDRPDAPPVFSTTSTDAVVPESAPVGYPVIRVNAQDGDTGIQNPIAYSIPDGKFSPFFAVNSSTGQVTLKQKIDREAEPFVSSSLAVFTVKASEVTSNPQPANISTATVQVRVTVQDVNDYRPTFSRTSYEFNVMEDTQRNIPLSVPAGGAEIEVEDKDLGKSGEFNVSLTQGGNPFTVFRPSSRLVFNKATILLRVDNSTALDFERVRNFSFQIVAVDQASPFHSASASVLVHILNMNDNQPRFTKQRYNFAVAENSAADTFVGRVEATDADVGDYGRVSYSLVGNKDEVSKFQVDNATGAITVAPGASLDRESSAYYFLNLMARDAAGLSTYTQVQITVTDRNDNPPTFSRSLYTATVTEGETTVLGATLYVQATDVDQGPHNNAITYSIVAGNVGGHFSVNATTGQLVVVSPVDYEALPAGGDVINLIVEARDGGQNGTSLASNTTVRITVQDRNDQAPQFPNNYSVSINETWSGGSPVLQVNASDADKPGSLQSQLFYRIAGGGEDMFAIDAASGLISVETHTRLRVGAFSLRVLAVDRGAPPNTGSCTVRITVEDVNNKAPYFSSELVRHPVEENATVGSVLYNFTAQDSDAGAKLRYRIETEKMSAKFGRTSVLASSYDFRTLFAINEHGQVTLLRKLDREKADSITVPIVVNDTAAVGGDQTASAELILIVEDVNDEFPKFLHLNGSVYVLTVPESLGKDQYTSLTIQASDADDSEAITYSLDDPSGTFGVDASSGRVRLLRQLDFETTKHLNFNVNARDRAGHVTTAQVQVTVVDYNDNAPEFDLFPTPVHVKENASVGDLVATVNASDSDTAAGGAVQFSLLSGGGGKFKVEQGPSANQARVVLQAALDHETGKEYSLMLEAKDNPSGSTRLRSSKVMKIIVDDVNDNPPIFTRSSYSANTTESAGNNTQLEVVSASDKDTGDNGRLTYSLEGDANALSLFGVNTELRSGQWTGLVVTRRSLAHAAGCYSAKVVASDNGSPALSAKADLSVCVEDVNDYSPEFVSPDSTSRVQYINETAVGVLLLTVKAEDKDPIGDNRKVRYRMEGPGVAKFSLNADTGELKNVVKLDREAQSVYKLVLTAYDLGKPSRSSTTTLTVEVLDVDDNTPSFPSANFVQTLSVPEESEPDTPLPDGRKGRLIGNVSRADDADHGANKVICYFIVNQYYDFLYLDQYNGLLYATKKFDRESAGGDSVTLVIKAVGPSYCNSTFYQWRTPSAGRRRLLFLDSSSAIAFDPTDASLSKVVIQVSDVNDHQPAFDATSYFLGISRDSAPMTEITNFKYHVSDKDTSAITNLKFSIDGDIQISQPLRDELTAAKINPVMKIAQSGVLHTASNVYFTNQMVGYFTFKVKVMDGSFSTTANCTVYLLTPEQQIIAVIRDSTVRVGDFSLRFVRFLSNITGLSVNKDSIVTHRDDSGMHDSSKTDMYLHAYDPHSRRILTAQALILRLDAVDQTSLTTLYNQYNVIEVKPAVTTATASSMESVFRIALVATACGLGVLLLISCFCLWSCRRMYRRKLKSANVAAYGAANGTLGGIPGTTVDTYDGSNPIWLEHYDNWAMHNDATSDKESVGDEDDGADFNPYASGPSTNLDNTPPHPRRQIEATVPSDSASGSQGLPPFVSSRPPPVNGVPTLLHVTAI